MRYLGDAREIDAASNTCTHRRQCLVFSLQLQFLKKGKISHKEISKDITFTMGYDKTEERHNEAKVS